MTPASKLIPFDAINDRLMTGFYDLLREWFPNGKLKGREYLVGNLQGDPGESFSINIDTGKWADFAGGPSGPDALGLYAALFHDEDRVVAARELGHRYGLMERVGNSTAKVVPIRRDTENLSTKPKPKPEQDEWLPEVPAPGNAPEPNLSRWDHVHRYYTSDGEFARCVVRIDAKGSKTKKVLPLTYGTLNGIRGWHIKHSPTPRCPYGLDRAAAMPDAVLWIVAGEKKADALQSLFPDRPVMSWTGGDKAVTGTDWTSVSGRSVIIWPDADASGIGAAEKLAPILLAQENKVWVVNVEGMPDKWDADNAINGADYKWNAEQILEWVKPRLRARRKEALAAEAKPETDDKPKAAPRPAARGDADPLDVGTGKHGVAALGHNHGQYFYYSIGRKQVVTLSAASHKKLELMSIASVPHYWERTKFAGEKGVAWDSVAAHLMDLCHAVGVFDPTRIRGRGAWLDDGRSVLHLGDRLLVDSSRIPSFITLIYLANASP